MQPSSAPLQPLLGLPPIPDVSHQSTQHPLPLPLALPLHLQRPTSVIRSPHRPSNFPPMPTCDGPSPQPHTPWTAISPTAVSNTSNAHSALNIPPLQSSSTPSPLVSSATLHQPFPFDIPHFHTSSSSNIDASLSNHTFAPPQPPPADVIPIRHADKLRRLQTPGVVILIDVDALQNTLPMALNASFSISPSISYTTLLTLLSTRAHAHPARSIVTAHLISSVPVPNAVTAGFTVHSAAVVVPTLVRILAQESEGVQLIARAINRSFTLVIPPSLHYLDIVRHARFSGCDVDLWHLSDPPSEWTAEASVAHENVGALRLHDIRPFLPLIRASDDNLRPLPSMPSLPPDGSLASPTSVLSDTTLAHHMQTQTIGGISPTDSDSMAPLTSWMTERDFDLHFRHSLPTDLLVEGDTPPPSQSSQATASPPSSPPEPPTDSPPVSTAAMGVPKPNACVPVPFPDKPLLPENMTALNGRRHSRLDSEWRRRPFASNGFSNSQHVLSSLPTSSVPLSPFHHAGDKPVQRVRPAGENIVIKDRLMDIGPSSTQGMNGENTLRSTSSGSIRADGSSSSSCNGSGGGSSGHDDSNVSNAEKAHIERMEIGRTLGSSAPPVVSKAPTRGKHKGGRCTYREFCNRRQCNGIHTEMELAYFAKSGGRGRYCVGKQKLCARGMSCDGRRRRSGVCSFLHRGELPFCAACLGCHAGGVCEVDRDVTISEGQATNLVTAGCLVPLNAR